MKEALLELGYPDVYHMTNILAQNPGDTEMWKRAFDALYGGKGNCSAIAWWMLAIEAKRLSFSLALTN